MTAEFSPYIKSEIRRPLQIHHLLLYTARKVTESMTDDSLIMRHFPISDLHHPYTLITILNLIPSELLSQLNLSQSFCKLLVVKYGVRFSQYCTLLIFKVLAPQPLTSSLFSRSFFSGAVKCPTTLALKAFSNP